MKAAVLERLNAARRERRSAAVVTDLASGAGRLVVEGDDLAAEPLAPEIARRLKSGVSGVDAESGAFITVHLPPTRLILVGAVHVTQGLVPMARLAGFDTVVVDPRTGFASPERFPGVEIVREWPQEAMPRLKLDHFTAVATLTHVPDIDDPALIAALRAECFYIGALGSRKSHAKRVERLHAAGFTDADIARIRAPIGLPIGGQSPAEIAVAIVAEVIDTRHRRTQTAPEP